MYPFSVDVFKKLLNVFTENTGCTNFVLTRWPLYVNSFFHVYKGLPWDSSVLNGCLQSAIITAQKKKLTIKDFFSKYDQIRRKLRISPHLLKKSLMENFIFCAVNWIKRLAWFIKIYATKNYAIINVYSDRISFMRTELYILSL